MGRNKYKLSKQEEYIILCLREGMKVGIGKIPIITVDYLYGQNRHNTQYTSEGYIEYRPCDSNTSKNKRILKKHIRSLRDKKIIYKDWDSYYHILYRLTEKGEDIDISIDKLDVTDELYKATKYGKMDYYISNKKQPNKKVHEYIDVLRKIKRGDEVDILDELNNSPSWPQIDFIEYIAPKLYPELFYFGVEPKRGLDWFRATNDTKENIILFCLTILGLKRGDNVIKELYRVKVQNPNPIWMPDPYNFHYQQPS